MSTGALPPPYIISRRRGGREMYWAGFVYSDRPNPRFSWSPSPQDAVQFVRSLDASGVLYGLRLQRSAHKSSVISLPVLMQRSGVGPDAGNRSLSPLQAVTAGETAPNSTEVA